MLLLNSCKFLYMCIYYWHVFQYFRAVKLAVRPFRHFLPQSIYYIINKKEAWNVSKGENIFQRKDGRREARCSKGYELPAVPRRFV